MLEIFQILPLVSNASYMLVKKVHFFPSSSDANRLEQKTKYIFKWIKTFKDFSGWKGILRDEIIPSRDIKDSSQFIRISNLQQHKSASEFQLFSYSGFDEVFCESLKTIFPAQLANRKIRICGKNVRDLEKW